MMHTATRDDVNTTVYRHLAELYKHMYFEIFNQKLTDMDKAIISYTAYQEMIQMGQDGYIDNYYERIRRNAV